MTFNDVQRNDVSTLIQQAYANDFLAAATKTSAVLSAFPTKNLGTKTTNLPVLSTKPHASWVGESATDSAGTKPTRKVTWANKTLVVEELAVIIPVHEDVVADATEDVVAEITKTGGEAIGFALDAAVIFGTGKPLSWVSNDFYTSAVSAGHVFNPSTTGGPDDLAGQFLQAAEGLAELYNPTTVLAKAGLKYRLANLRSTQGEPIYMGSMSDTPGGDSIYGMNTFFVTGTVDDGAGGDQLVWNPSTHAGIDAVVIDRSRVIIGVRQDITVKFLDQAVVGGVSLAEKDMVALRFKARFAYCLGDNIAYGSTVSTNSPVCILTTTDES